MPRVPIRARFERPLTTDMDQKEQLLLCVDIGGGGQQAVFEDGNGNLLSLDHGSDRPFYRTIGRYPDEGPEIVHGGVLKACPIITVAFFAAGNMALFRFQTKF